LGDTESKLLDLGPSVANAQAVLARTIVRSPYSGKVVGLKVFSTGAVVAPGGTILDIVPDGTDLIVEAKIRVEDISDVHPGSDAEIHFTTYKKLYVPTLRATITTVSADRLTDERSGIAYYLAQLVVDPSDLARNGQISLYPGMPAHNPGFDVTPARLVTGLITERGRCEASAAGLRGLYPEAG